MVDQNIRLLKKKFYEIKNMGYVKGVRSGPTGIGATFESLLGKEEDNFEIPDYNGIEIKARRAYSKSAITLFSAVPTGSSFHEAKRLRDIYGYPDSLNSNLKQLNVDVFANKVNNAGANYYFLLGIDIDNSKLKLLVYDKEHNLIDDSTYWDFDILKEKLYRKLQVLALVKAWTNKIDGVEGFYYYKINFYILKDFDAFIMALRKGKVKVTIKIGSYRYGRRYGQVYNHGISFSISEDDLLEVFDIYR